MVLTTRNAPKRAYFFALTRFPHANRHPPPDQVRGHASLENALLGVFIVVLGGGNGIGIRQPAVQIDVPAALGAERTRRLGGRLAADRARFWGALSGFLPLSPAGRGTGRLSWHSTSRSGSENLRHRAASSIRTAAGRRHCCRSR